jgi:hypothetical protein
MVTVAMVLLASKATVITQNFNFDSDAAGVAPKEWTVTLTGTGNPKWTIEPDDTAPSKGHMLQQSGNATYPLALKVDTSIADGFVEVKFKAISGSADRAGGLVWRAKDANNYYVVRANALEGNVVLYKTVNGQRSALDIRRAQGRIRRQGAGPSQPVACAAG